jgi:hypothetical protein
MQCPYNTWKWEKRVYLQKENKQRKIEAKEHIVECTELIDTIQTQKMFDTHNHGTTKENIIKPDCQTTQILN